MYGNVAINLADYLALLLTILFDKYQYFWQYCCFSNIAGRRKKNYLMNIYSFHMPNLIIQFQNCIKPGGMVSLV